MKEFFKENFSDMISQKSITTPEGIVSYDAINFQKLITRLFSDFDLTISIDRSNISKKLIDKYKSEKSCFKEHGSLKEYSLTNLLYYQTDTGLEGPKYHDVNEPVSILKYMDLLILWEGYHRTLIKIATDHLKCKINGYELEL